MRSSSVCPFHADTNPGQCVGQHADVADWTGELEACVGGEKSQLFAVDDLHHLINQNGLCLDAFNNMGPGVRAAGCKKDPHASGVDDANQRFIYNASSKQIVFYCAAGERSAMAVKLAGGSGVRDCAHLPGGYEAWLRAGGATE